MTKSQTLDGQYHKTVNKIFQIFSAIYPSWQRGKSEKQTNIAKRLWLRHLKSFEIFAIERALDEVVDLFPSFAPTLGEFKQLLITRPEHRLVEPLALPEPRDEKLAAASMKNIISLVGKKRV